MKSFCLVTLLVLVFFGGAASRAETTGKLTLSSRGRLVGFILDPGVARVPAAKIIVASRTFKRELKSGDDGSYEVDLPSGKYTVRVERDGFYPSRRTTRITPNGTTHLNITIRGMRNDASHP